VQPFTCCLRCCFGIASYRAAAERWCEMNRSNRPRRRTAACIDGRTSPNRSLNAATSVLAMPAPTPTALNGVSKRPTEGAWLAVSHPRLFRHVVKILAGRASNSDGRAHSHSQHPAFFLITSNVLADQPQNSRGRLEPVEVICPPRHHLDALIPTVAPVIDAAHARLYMAELKLDGIFVPPPGSVQ
jgi:hypothetical protein